MVLHGPHARHLQVLPGRAGLAIPEIIGDIDEHLSAVGGELAYFTGKDRFIADENAIASAVQVEDLALRSRSKVPDFARQLFSEKQEFLQGHIFAEGHQMDLVIATYHLALRIQDERGVEQVL